MSRVSPDYLHPAWRSRLEAAGWDRFEHVWDLDHEWVDELNHRRGGWGGVARHELTGSGDPAAVFLKVHVGQASRSLRHPLRGQPTLARELSTLQRCRALGIACPEPVYYATRRIGGELRVLLATAELVDYQPLRTWLAQWELEPPSAPLRDAVIRETASLLRKLHAARFKVNAFTLDHVFVRLDPAPQACLIDLERMKPTWQPGRTRVHDLATLLRSARKVRRTDRLRFLLAYLERSRPDDESRRLWRAASQRREKRDAERERRVG